MALTVVKVGGSLVRSGEAEAVLRVLAAEHAGRAVVVPGGGAFADAVRDAQRNLGFPDPLAHHLALLAMEMSGRMLASLSGAYRFAPSLDAARAECADGQIPVCVPVSELLADTELPASWDVTSDSISAWIARRLGAGHLVLVKSCAVPDTLRPDAPALASAGIVDAAFPSLVAQAGFAWDVTQGVAGLSALMQGAA